MPDVQNLEFPVVSNFSPEAPVEIFGIQDTTKVVATIDTGYTGFLTVPIAVGLKANLRLFGLSYYQMADGRRVKKLECFGKIRFAGKELWGIIALSETSEDCLLGMQFLERLKGDFTVSIMNKKAIFSIPVEEKPKEGKTDKQADTKQEEPAKEGAIKKKTK
jgi:clan AA aspartic protease